MPNIPPGATGVVTIDLARLADNYRSLAELVAPAECAAVVKADAYGLGAARVIPTLLAAGCRTFFIATVDEAREARRLAPSATLYVLNGLLPGTGAELAAIDARAVLGSLAEIREWAARSTIRNRRLPAALHVDSGLNRLGMSAKEVHALAADRSLLAGIDVKLVMSHLASADDPADPKNEAQLAAFQALRAELPPAPASLAASDGLMLGRAYHFDMVRPGYALYGGQAFQGGPTPVAPVVRVEARILQIRDVAPGETVGYSATYRVNRPSRIAVVAAGYGDGFARTSSATDVRAGGFVGFKDRLAPVVGRVSMDLITVDVTDLHKPEPQPGDMVVLVGGALTLESVGAHAGTIGYEVLTRLGRRFHRVYIDDRS